LRDLLEQLRLFPGQTVFELHEAGGIATRASQTNDKAGAEWVGYDREYYRHGASRRKHLLYCARVIAAYNDHVVMKETLAEALSALFETGAAPGAPSTSTATPLAALAAALTREALDHYNQARTIKIRRLAGFGTQLDAMRGLLEELSRQSIGH
jgi:hypothetical protein